MTAVGASVDRSGVIDLYRAVWTAGSGVFGRPRVRLGIELAFLGAWLVLRMAGAGFGPTAAWTAAAAVLAILSPGSGLVVLAAIAPWDEPLFLSRALGLRHLLPLALVLSVGLRIVLHPRSVPRSVPFFVALGLLAITLVLGVGSMYLRYGRVTGWDTAHSWLAGFGGAMIVFLVATWLGHAGDRRPLWAAVIAATAAGLLSLADYLLPAALAGVPFQGLLADKEFGTRLAGAIASPNAMVSLLVTPTAVLAAALVLGRDRRLRVAAAVVLPPLLLAMWFTYSRAAILGVFAIAVIVLWRWRRWVGAGLLVVGLVAGIALAPSYLQARGERPRRRGGGRARQGPHRERRAAHHGVDRGQPHVGGRAAAWGTASAATSSSAPTTATTPWGRPTTSGSACSRRRASSVASSGSRSCCPSLCAWRRRRAGSRRAPSAGSSPGL